MGGSLSALHGIRIVDLSQNLAGPYCTQILADLGAEVIKVEPPGGDPARSWGPPFCGDQSTLFLAANRNKRSIVLDLKTARGRDVLRRLVGRSDVFVQSFRVGVVAALGFGYEVVREIQPRIIYASVTAYGTRGPLAPLPGYDPLLQARGGLMSVTGQPEQPARVGTSIIDMGTGMWAALGILTALRERERTHVGTHLVASLFDTAIAWNAYHLMGYFATGAAPGPLGTGFASIAPYGSFAAADGALMIAAANDGLFVRLCEALGLGELLGDERYRDNPGRVSHRIELERRIAGTTVMFSREQLETMLRDAGVPCAPIQGVAEVAHDEQTAATGMISDEATDAPGYRSVALPLEWNGVRPGERTRPPAPGEHTSEILAELGLEAE